MKDLSPNPFGDASFAAMNDATKLHYEAKSKELRADLKRWENEWADGHGGTKPGRQDIKDNPDIAQKYKEYNKVRGILAGKVPPLSMDESSSKKRRPDPTPSETPLKRAKYTETPSKDRIRDDELMNTPGISRKLFSPAPVTSLGPTPQRDGRVLGLFDLLVEKELGTPSRKNRETGNKGGRQNNVYATPSKRTSTSDLDSDGRLGRTPMSTSKRQLLNTFMTPRKNRKENLGGKTPTSVSKLQFDTPAFLKRHSLPTLDEDAKFAAPSPLRLPRKPMVRGLSEIVASLRKVEDDRLDDDDDLDALREAESAELGTDKPKPLPQAPRSSPAPAHVLVEDSEDRQLPLGGFDDEGMYDSPVEDALDRSGNPLVVYKKKGQKRTTRKAIIKPTWAKRPATMAESNAGDEDGEGLIPDTQAVPGANTQVTAADDSDADFVDDEAQSSNKKAKSGKGRAGKAKAGKDDAKKEGTVKKAVRKVNELAHANFQRLKLRTNGAKGGPGYNSKFRRRR
ncbi:DNA replication regulator SLD2 [Tolypocladium ophioglossoides CBS 100239]|uniref:DNA replication regulator SLD2 n=1 Tax=Tolypocladium ophioglossoides (strain CBS 100239) TaxID=1163406 RepID=A0A0L0N5S5_TOLOC|nr:DNA replication regulator SLD2 [Tolypocladium ophioglossoides CBS 100239]